MTFTFTLPNIDPIAIERKFNITYVTDTNILETNITDTPPPVSDRKNITKITELETESISFQDQSKKIHTCQVSMIDYNTMKNPQLLCYNCFWCKHPFDNQPIGCPIEYVPNTAIKKYFSEISKDNYFIKEHITKNKEIPENLIVKKKNYYISDGVFCSFNCALAFAQDNRHIKLYENSTILLNKILVEITEDKKFTIDPAPHWRLLIEYGGYMNIERFRNSFNKSYFNAYGIIKNLPNFKSVGWLYEERLKF